MTEHIVVTIFVILLTPIVEGLLLFVFACGLMALLTGIHAVFGVKLLPAFQDRMSHFSV